MEDRRIIMRQAIKNPFSSSEGAAVQSGTPAALLGAAAMKGALKTDVILVFFHGSGHTLIQLKRSGNRYRSYLPAAETAAHSKRDHNAWKKSILIVCLPKSRYLTKTLHIPQVEPHEVPSILRLEAEAQLPADYGPIEIAYTPLAGSEENGYRSYWVYICQMEVLDRCLSELSAYSILPQMILPSSVCWQQFFRQYPDFNAVAVPVNENGLEVSFPDAQGRVVTRTLSLLPEEGQESGIIRCISSALGSGFAEEKDFTIGWFAPDQSVQTNSGRVRFLNLPDFLDNSVLDGEALIRQHPGSFLAANLLLQDSLRGVGATENLVPSELLHRFEVQRLYRKTAMGFLAILLGLIVVFAALQASIYRYERITEHLHNQIERIRQEGLYAGKQIEQLKAVHAAVRTRNDFNELLLGLHEATPFGITYSHIELLKTGEVRLRGSSPSLSSLFLLPERLEKQPLFERVQLEDAGQTNRSGGSIAEFVIKMQFMRQPK